MRATPRQEAARQRIAELLAELADVIGPTGDGQVDYEPGDEPRGNATLWEYVVVGYWEDEDGKDFVVVIPDAGMRPHHTVGLLRAGLRVADDTDDGSDERESGR